MLHLICVGVFATVSAVAGQPFTVFRPQGYGDAIPFGEGRGPDPLNMEFHLTQVEATLGADVCAGQHDVLAVTMPSPVVGDIKPTQFSVLVCPLELDNDEDYGGVSYWPPNFDQCETVVPACARLQLADEPQERRTLLLFGQFVQFEDQVAVWALADFTIDEVTFLIDGEQVSEYGSYTSGQGIGACVLLACFYSNN